MFSYIKLQDPVNWEWGGGVHCAYGGLLKKEKKRVVRGSVTGSGMATAFLVCGNEHLCVRWNRASFSAAFSGKFPSEFKTETSNGRRLAAGVVLHVQVMECVHPQTHTHANSNKQNLN